MKARPRPLFLVAAINLALIAHAPGARADPPRIGDPAPPLDLPGEHDSRVSLLPNQVNVVDFYATWCGPCQQAMTALDAIGRALGWRFHLIVVDVDEDPAIVSHKPVPDRATLAFDRDSSAARRWGQTRFPTTFIVDEHNIIRRINRGYGSGYETRLRIWLKALLPAQ